MVTTEDGGHLHSKASFCFMKAAQSYVCVKVTL